MIGPFRRRRQRRKAAQTVLFPVRQLAEDMVYCIEGIGLTEPDVPFDIDVTVEPTIVITYMPEGIKVTWRPEVTRI